VWRRQGRHGRVELGGVLRTRGRGRGRTEGEDGVERGLWEGVSGEEEEERLLDRLGGGGGGEAAAVAERSAEEARVARGRAGRGAEGGGAAGGAGSGGGGGERAEASGAVGGEGGEGTGGWETQRAEPHPHGRCGRRQDRGRDLEGRPRGGRRRQQPWLGFAEGSPWRRWR
jgi:hypothetical protein